MRFRPGISFAATLVSCLALCSCSSVGSGKRDTGDTDASGDTNPTAKCDNGTIEADEICDGTDLGSHDCASRGFVDGILKCASDCTSFDTTSCEAAVGASCTEAQCVPGAVCVAGRCVLVCNSASDCPASQDCRGSVCFQTCMGQVDCSSDLVCSESYFGPSDGSKHCVPRCSGDDDCLSPLSAACNPSTRECGPCGGDVACERFPVFPHCAAGSCVECTDLTHCVGMQRCEGNACIGGVLGEPCQLPSNCVGGECMTEITWGFSGGFCTQPCTQDTECPEPAICDGSIRRCLFACGMGAICPPGLGCGAKLINNGYFAEGDERNKCIPACPENAPCIPDLPVCDTASGSCQPCDVDANCAPYPDHPYCPAQVCVQCTSNAHCDAGEICTSNTCSVPPGSPCALNEGCGSGAICLVGPSFPGGYCALLCISGSGCASGECTSLLGVCLVPCSDTSECRAGYECTTYDGGTALVCVGA